MTVNQTGTVAGTSNSIRQAVSTGFVGQMSVDPNYVIIGNGGMLSIVCNILMMINSNSKIRGCDMIPNETTNRQSPNDIVSYLFYTVK